MSRQTPIADHVNALWQLWHDGEEMFADVDVTLNTHMRRVIGIVNSGASTGRTARLSTLLERLDGIRAHTARRVGDEGMAAVTPLIVEHAKLKMLLLNDPPAAAPAGGGHLHAFDHGEPGLRDGAQYAPADLVRSTSANERLIQIGEYGDCWLIAPYMAARDAGTVSVEQRGETVVVTVAAGTYEVPATLPVKDGGPWHAHGSEGSNEVAYVEKAAAMHFGSYNDLQAGFGGYALEWLANSGEGRSDQLADFDDAFLTDLFASDQPTTVGSPYFAAGTDTYDLAEQHNVIPDLYHAYHVVGVTTTDEGQPAVQLWNSLSATPPTPMTMPVFRELFTDLDWIDPQQSQEAAP